MTNNKELDINDNKDINVLMDADFSFLLGKNVLSKNITQKKAIELIHNLDVYPTTPKSCAKVISAKYILSIAHWNKFNKKSNTNTIELGLEIGKCMKCQKKTAGMTQRDKDTLCAENIKSGKCRDKMVCETIGTVLFPELYQKTK